jgi:hypothetical protein
MQGMRQMIANNPDMRIIIEFAPGHIRRSGRNPEAFLDELPRPGFILRSINGLSGELTAEANSTILSAANTNLLVSRL